MSAAKSEYFIRLRSYPDSPVSSIWLVERTGKTESGLLFGELSPARAEAVCVALEAHGLRIDRETAPYSVSAPLFDQLDAGPDLFPEE
jgi:hypothetical protein